MTEPPHVAGMCVGRFTDGTLDGQYRLFLEAHGWPDRYHLVVTGEVWNHAGGGRYVLDETETGHG